MFDLSKSRSETGSYRIKKTGSYGSLGQVTQKNLVHTIEGTFSDLDNKNAQKVCLD